MQKTCSKCGETKALDEFNRKVDSKDGRRSQCKECRRIKRLDGAEEKREYNRAYYRANRQAILEQKREYHLQNADERCAYNRQRYYDNREAIIAQNVKYKRSRRASDPAFRFRESFGSAINSALKAAGTSKNGHSCMEFLPYSVEELRQHLENQFEDWMSWENYGSNWHIDHTLPQAAFQFSSVNDQGFKDCWQLANLRPLEASENMSKGDTINPSLVDKYNIQIRPEWLTPDARAILFPDFTEMHNASSRK